MLTGFGISMSQVLADPGANPSEVKADQAKPNLRQKKNVQIPSIEVESEDDETMEKIGSRSLDGLDGLDESADSVSQSSQSLNSENDQLRKVNEKLAGRDTERKLELE